MTAPQQIVIAGGGTAGWIAASLFAHHWRREQVAVTLIEAPDIGIIGVGEGSTPSLKRFFEVLGIPEADWMPACNATYKASIRFRGWSPASGVAEYSHPFTTQLDVHTEEALFGNCRNRRLGHAVPTLPDAFLLNGLLAAQGKAPVAPDNFPFRMEYGYHFDSALLGAFLRDRAVGEGVRHVSDRIVTTEQAGDGAITAVVTGAGERITGDWFVDCSGFAGLLMERALKVPFRSFRDNLFNDSAVVIPTPATDAPAVETVSTALSAGWCWSIPLTSRVGNGYVYSSDHLAADAAEAELRQMLGLSSCEFEARHLRFRVGQLELHWDRNCIAVGLSQGFIEPLEATAIHLVLNTVEQFIKALDEGGFTAQNRDAFNAVVTERIERVRDYIVAHYKLNTRDDTDYWRANRENMALSEPLLHVLDTWFRRGDLGAELERQQSLSHFGNVSWHCLLAGYSAFPPASAAARNDVDFYADRGVERFLAGCALNFPHHAQALAALRAGPGVPARQLAGAA